MEAKIDQFLRAIAEMKELLPEAHSTIKELRAASKEATRAVELIQSTARTEVAATLRATVDEVLPPLTEKLTGEVKRIIERSESQILHRFRTLEGILFGDGTGEPLEDLARKAKPLMLPRRGRAS